MATLVVGASGATGRLLVEQLLDRGDTVRIVVRSTSNLPEKVLRHENLSIVKASILDLDDQQLTGLLSGCDAVASCLGHNMTFKGIFGNPRRLVTNSIQRICDSVVTINPKIPLRVVLMNTSGYINRDRNEKVSFAQICIIWLLRLLLPPHVDNEQAAEYLRIKIGQENESIEWCAVRPDSLIDKEAVTDYHLHQSPIRSAIFDSGETSRINVGHFMAELITDKRIWAKWKGQMPVIYNSQGNT